jgi:hypothetical protein
MHRIDNATAAATPPTPDPAGTPGHWTKGDPGTGTPATVMDQDWFQAVQEEFMSLLAAGGVSPVKGAHNQVLAALNVLYRPGRLQTIRIFSSSGTYTPTAGMGRVRVTAIGGGGAGGGAGVASSGNVSLGAAGGAGTVAQGLFTAVQVGSSLAVTIGAGGAPASGGVGGTGGSTSFGALLTCPGGPGGGLSNDTPFPTLNANGSVSSSATGTVLWQAVGGSDGFSFALAAGGGAGGPGGRSFFGIGTPPVAFNGAAVNGVSPGSGGSGIVIGSGVGPFPGGAGAAGLVIIEEFTL